MAYTALYRKWRPASFADVKGQDAIVTTLRNQLRSGRIGHAYLFCGTRGTGKTTVAKIFARAVNCEHPSDGDPCGECAVCRAIESGAAMNVVEIDAASNNGVDNIREIREEVQYSPADGKYRVYIIDEVHMLSTGAFNALLKTLEEPPSYVIFILATTEPHKIPVTVLSRCQRYDFKRISADVLISRLRELAEYEQVQAEDRALAYIAKKADGAMRDAISLLDQCVAFHMGEELTYEKVLSVLGAVDNEVFSRFFRGLMSGSPTDCLGQIEELVMGGRELSQFVQDFIWFLRDLLLLGTSNVGSEVLGVTEENRRAMQADARLTDANGLMRMIRLFSELYNQMRNAVNKRVLLEIAVIRTSVPEMEENLESVEERIRRLEEKVKKGIPAAPAVSAAAPREEKSSEPEAPEVVELPAAQYDDLMKVKESWEELIGQVTAEDYPAGKSLAGTRPEPKQEGILSVVFFDASYYNRCKVLDALALLRDKAVAMLGKELAFEARLAPKAAPEPVYQRLTDEDLAVFQMPVEEED